MRLIKALLIAFFVTTVTVTAVHSYRMQRPKTFTYPMKEQDVQDLNSILEELFFMQQGRFELDKVKASKTNANTGEIWIKQTGSTYKLEVMVDGTIYSISL